MKTKVHHLTALAGAIIVQVWSIYPLKAQFRFTGVQPITNREVTLTLSAPTGSVYRIDTTTDLLGWTPLVLVTGAIDSVQYTDSAAPYLPWRFYRAEQLANTNILLGDCLSTTNSDVIIRPLFHATFVMSWNGKMIYNDPASGVSYTGLAKADLILLSHTHSDHFSTAIIEAVRKTNTVIVAPQSVYNT